MYVVLLVKNSHLLLARNFIGNKNVRGISVAPQLTCDKKESQMIYALVSGLEIVARGDIQRLVM